MNQDQQTPDELTFLKQKVNEDFDLLTVAADRLVRYGMILLSVSLNGDGRILTTEWTRDR